MPKPIKITDDMKQKAQDEFALMLNELKMTDGKINYSKSFKYENAAAVLWLAPVAYSKTVILVAESPDEVAWHGLAKRNGKSDFIIEDIVVYPQEVTGSTVSTDQERYTEWLYSFDDETFNSIRMQGHSHVNMGVSPSGVDARHRERILEQLCYDMFYIFMVWNKSLRTHVMIFDMENNVLYEDDDITVRILGDDYLNDFLADAAEKVQHRRNHTSSENKSGKPPRNKKNEEPSEEELIHSQLYRQGYFDGEHCRY